MVFVILISCQNKSNYSTKHEIVDSGQVHENNEAKSLNSEEKEVPNRFIEGNVYKSHISIDFAKTTINIEDTSNLLIISKEYAVTIEPDSIWMINQEKTMPESTWNTVVMDNVNCENSAEDTLAKQKIPIVFASRTKKYIKFLKNNGTEYTIDLDKIVDVWGLILFNGIDNPDLWVCAFIDEGLRDVYKK